ncbi:hypothetical protein [Streptomyces zingiberis]|uniref:Right handed beta helix domain-containing protein n=1 Tax=Streptomyces zingiberis TaxID=2053010 RepID=A0ABX1BY41_9ACTN|nr:hypothetical protein [Streptomyces zingiberis]NJP99583.1 hypothetical protein [Streptomyces zingiberis]
MVAVLALVVGAVLVPAPSANAATITVCASGCDYTTISAAITAASAGDTITVGPGTYNEQITIDKSLTVRGAQAGVDPSPTGRPGGESTISSTYAVTIAANNVVFTGFEVRDFRQGVRSTGTWSNIEISYNWIHEPTTTTDLLGILLEPALLTGVTITHNIVHTEETGDSLAAIGISSSGPTPEIDDLEISYNDIGNSLYGLFDGADPAVYKINGFSLTGNYFHDNESNLNIGNILNGTVTGNVFADIGGSIGIDTGTISGNSFIDGGNLSLWGTEFGFWRPSRNLVVEHNDFTDEVFGRGLRVRSGAIASTITVRANAFRDSGIPPSGDPDNDPTGYILLNQGTGTLNAAYNWWGSASGPAGNTGGISGSVITAPWIASFVNDPAKGAPTTWPLTTLGLTGPVGFWPLVATRTTIVSKSPSRTVVGQPATFTGTVSPNGLGGVTSNLPVLPGQVTVTDGVASCTDTTLTATATLNVYQFSCTLVPTRAGLRLFTATYKDTSVDSFYRSSSSTLRTQVYLP